LFFVIFFQMFLYRCLKEATTALQDEKKKLIEENERLKRG